MWHRLPVADIPRRCHNNGCWTSVCSDDTGLFMGRPTVTLCPTHGLGSPLPAHCLWYDGDMMVKSAYDTILPLVWGQELRCRKTESLQNWRSGDRIPVGGEIFRTSPGRPGAHLPSCKMDTVSLFPGVKRPWSGADHLPPSSAEAKERV